MGFFDLQPRADAVKRILMFINIWTLGGLITGLIQILNLLWMSLDIIVQLVLGMSLPEWQFAKRNYRWYVNAHVYAVWGDGSPDWLPVV